MEFFPAENSQRAKSVVAIFPMHTNEDLLQDDVVPTVIDNILTMTRKKQVCLIILSFLGSKCCDFTSCFWFIRCIWSMLHSYFNQTAPEFIWKWTEAYLSAADGSVQTYSNELHHQSSVRRWRHKLSYILNGLRVRKIFSNFFHFGWTIPLRKYIFDSVFVCLSSLDRFFALNFFQSILLDCLFHKRFSQQSN